MFDSFSSSTSNSNSSSDTFVPKIGKIPVYFYYQPMDSEVIKRSYILIK